jgi:hypothetical protein
VGWQQDIKLGDIEPARNGTSLSVGFTGRKVGRDHFPLGRDNPPEPLMGKLFLHFLSDDNGATAIEYGLIAAGISIAIIAV